MSLRVNVDLTNPGQFFACCGLLELADRLWPGAEGWFEGGEFCVECDGDLRLLLQAASSTRIQGMDGTGDEVEAENDEEEDDAFEPIILLSPVALRLDWWQDKSLKPWAGSMKVKLITVAMSFAVDPDSIDPLGQTQVVFDPPTLTTTGKPKKPKKREPFYFDSRRGANATALDIGFMPDTIKTLKTFAHPAVEFFALVGLQRCRPRPTDTPRVFDYFTWAVPCGTAVLPLAVCGLLGDPHARGYRFENAFRTGQKKHKAFNPATPFRGSR